MEIRKILVPTDGSVFTDDALDAATYIAKMAGATITVVNVIDRASVIDMPLESYDDTITMALNREADKMTSYAVDRIRGQGIEADRKILAGSPADAIAEESENYDMIIMSSLGRTGMGKYLSGSVAEKVVRSAKCPVTIIRGRQ